MSACAVQVQRRCSAGAGGSVRGWDTLRPFARRAHSLSCPRASPPLSSNLDSEMSHFSQHPPRRGPESAQRRQSLSMEARGAGAEGPGAWQAVPGLVAARRTLVSLRETGAGRRGDRKPTGRPGQSVEETRWEGVGVGCSVESQQSFPMGTRGRKGGQGSRPAESWPPRMSQLYTGTRDEVTLRDRKFLLRRCG